MFNNTQNFHSSPVSLIWTNTSVLVNALPFQPNRHGCHANTICICTLWNIFTSWVNRSVALQWQWSSYSCGVLGWKYRIPLWYLRMTVLWVY